MDGAISAYTGPHPYANTPPFDQARGLTYRQFDPASGAGPHHSAPSGHYEQGFEPNWQSQHPPLYYALLAPVRMVLGEANWSTQFFWLRFVSWMMAFAGLVIGVEAALRHNALPEGGALIMAAWPFLFPQFFPEMARMGNDSLCLFFMGLSMMFFLRLEDQPRVNHALGLSLSLGLGLWTKAFFLPITVGFALYFIVSGLNRWRDSRLNQEWVVLRAGVITIAWLLGGGWYLYKVLSTGSVTGGDEFIQLGQDSGFISSFITNVSMAELVRGLSAIGVSFVWAGSWSLARPPEILMLGPTLLLALTLMRWGLDWRQLPERAQSVVFIASPMVAGLVFHLFVRMAAGEGGSGTPGWYLHILAPVAGIAVAWGYRHSTLAIVLTLYTLLFTASAWLLQLSMFSGCAAKLGENKHYTLDGANCLFDPVQLSALGFPQLGVIALTLSGMFALTALYRAWKGGDSL